MKKRAKPRPKINKNFAILLGILLFARVISTFFIKQNHISGFAISGTPVPVSSPRQVIDTDGHIIFDTNNKGNVMGGDPFTAGCSLAWPKDHFPQCQGSTPEYYIDVCARDDKSNPLPNDRLTLYEYSFNFQVCTQLDKPTLTRYVINCDNYCKHRRYPFGICESIPEVDCLRDDFQTRFGPGGRCKCLPEIASGPTPTPTGGYA